MTRLFSFLFFLLILLSPKAQVSVHLENGQTIEGRKYKVQDSILMVDTTSIPLSSILLLRYHKLTYIFVIDGMKKQKTAITESQSVCNRARLFAQRYKNSRVNPYATFDPLVAAKDTNEWRNCFLAEFADMGISPFPENLPRISYDNKAITYDSTMLVMRTGDTITVSGPMYLAKGIIRFSSVGITAKQQDVLLILTPNGQKVIHASSGKLVFLKPQITKLEPCSYGIIYARIYWDAVVKPAQILGLEKTLREHDDFIECFYRKQDRMIKVVKTFKIATGVLGVARGVNGGLKTGP